MKHDIDRLTEIAEGAMGRTYPENEKDMAEGIEAVANEVAFPLLARIAELEAVLADARSGLNYIRECHGDLYGVGFNRVEKAAAALLDRKTVKETP